MSGLQVQLCETRRELQELKASLRVAQKEKEQLLAEKQVGGISHKGQLESVFFAKGLSKRLEFPCACVVSSAGKVWFCMD